MSKTGLILEGGGMRGLYTAGVLDRLMEASIPVDGMVTVSAGALFGINFASAQHGRALRYNKTYIKDKRYMSLRSLLTTGNLINKNFAYYTIPYKLDAFDEKAFKASGIDFYAAVTNMHNGQAEYRRITDPFDQMEILRASGSLPIVSRPVELEGKLYLDGGVADSIPYRKAKALGYAKRIVILTRPLTFKKTPSPSFLIDRWYKDYPQFRRTLKNRYRNYNQTVEHITEDEAEGEAFVFRPSQSLAIKRLERDKTKLQSMYDLGVEDADHRLDQLRMYLQKTN